MVPVETWSLYVIQEQEYLSSNKFTTCGLQSAVKVHVSLRHSEDPRRSMIPAGGRLVADRWERGAPPWTPWKRWRFCGLFLRCVFSASDRVRLPPALWKSWWSRCTEWDSRRCWWEEWRLPPSWRWCLEERESQSTLKVAHVSASFSNILSLK